MRIISIFNNQIRHLFNSIAIQIEFIIIYTIHMDSDSDENASNRLINRSCNEKIMQD
jgi:hypothetical protein